MDRGIIQIAGIVSITAMVISAIALNQIEFATQVGMVGVGAVAGFLGNEVINRAE